jgi:hypothetical protein
MRPMDHMDGAISAMRSQRIPYLLLLAVAVAGCAAGSMASPKADGGTSRRDASSSSDGGMITMPDAGSNLRDAATSKDAKSHETQLVTPSLDAPAFNWDAQKCLGCVGGSGTGGFLGAGGVGGKAGSTGRGGTSGIGGTVGSGGFGGSSNADGGSTSRDSGSMDGSVAVDSPGYFDAIGPKDASVELGPSPDSGIKADASTPDLKPTDAYSPDATTACATQIRAIVPATTDLEKTLLIAGPSTLVVLRAEIVSGGPAAGATWTWQGSKNGTPIAKAAIGQEDSAAAAFPIPEDGIDPLIDTYTFTVVDSTRTCSATIQVSAAGAEICNRETECGQWWTLRAAPPPNAEMLPFEGSVQLKSSPPFSQVKIVLGSGEIVQVAPSVAGSLVTSYVRINIDGNLVADGLAAPQAAFTTRLPYTDGNGRVVNYDVLIVPLNSSSQDAIGATAPQLFQGLSSTSFKETSFKLTGGFAVTGSIVDANGLPVVDTRVMLTNQDPSSKKKNEPLIFSSIGSSDSNGNYVLHVQPGQYWMSVSPPSNSGLAEALSPASIPITGDTTIGFQWEVISKAPVSLSVLDASGAVSVGTRVRLTSSKAKKVGNLMIRSSTGGPTTLSADGNVRIEAMTSSSGVANFTNIPDETTYEALLVPATLSVSAATTTLSVTVPAGGLTQVIRLLAEGRINGKLAASASGSPEWSQVTIVAYDRSEDTPETPRAITANPDGTFAIGVSPGRRYVVLAVPPTGSGYARTFVGPGFVMANEFTITQKVQASMDWISTVTDTSDNGLAETALQAFCIAGWPYCNDPTVPIAEATSEADGSFHLVLPNPLAQ